MQFAMDENKIQQNRSILNLFLFQKPVKRDVGKKSVETVRKHGKLPYRIYRQRWTIVFQFCQSKLKNLRLE